MTDPTPDDPDAPLPSLWDALGLPEPTFLPDADAPPVDPALVSDLVAGRLEPSTAEGVHLLISRFHPWRAAFARALGGPAEPLRPAATSHPDRDWERYLDWVLGVARGLAEGGVDAADREPVVAALDGYRRAVREGRSAARRGGGRLWAGILDRGVAGGGTRPEGRTAGGASGETAADHTTPAADDMDAARRVATELARCLRAAAAWGDLPLLRRIVDLGLRLHSPGEIAAQLDEEEDLIGIGLRTVEERWADGSGQAAVGAANG